MPISTADVFTARESWVSAPRDFIAQISSLLESPAKAQEFCLLVEDLRMVHKIIALASSHLETEPLALLLATIICEQAYTAAKKNDYRAAEFMWGMALTLYSDHLPSKAGLAILHFNKGNYPKALKYADDVIRVHENPTESRGVMNDLVTGKWEPEAAKSMGKPGIVGSSQAIFKQMCMIRDVVRREAPI